MRSRFYPKANGGYIEGLKIIPIDTDILKKFITEHKLYNIKQSDGLENNIKIVLYLIEKLQKENEKYKQFFDLMLRLDSDYFMNCGDEETNELVDEILKLESE